MFPEKVSIDPFFSKNQNFDPKHKIPKNQWEKFNRFHYCQISKGPAAQNDTRENPGSFNKILNFES